MLSPEPIRSEAPGFTLQSASGDGYRYRIKLVSSRRRTSWRYFTLGQSWSIWMTLGPDIRGEREAFEGAVRCVRLEFVVERGFESMHRRSTRCTEVD